MALLIRYAQKQETRAAIQTVENQAHLQQAATLLWPWIVSERPLPGFLLGRHAKRCCKLVFYVVGIITCRTSTGNIFRLGSDYLHLLVDDICSEQGAEHDEMLIVIFQAYFQEYRGEIDRRPMTYRHLV